MRRLCGLILMATLALGCGSTGNNDQLVFQFVRFDDSGLTQQDAMRETSADVDNVQDICQVGPPLILEPFTNTTINVVFRNMEASDIRLERVVIDTGPTSQYGVITRDLTGVIPGGRCSSGAQCGSDADCVSSSTAGTCTHTETTISAILLFDVFDKQHIHTGTDNVRISFFASDPNRSFEASTSYVVTFADFNNCPSTSGGSAPTPTPTPSAG
jgi:hypothetical protein